MEFNVSTGGETSGEQAGFQTQSRSATTGLMSIDEFPKFEKIEVFLYAAAFFLVFLIYVIQLVVYMQWKRTKQNTYGKEGHRLLGARAISMGCGMTGSLLFALAWMASWMASRTISTDNAVAVVITGYSLVWFAYVAQAPRHFVEIESKFNEKTQHSAWWRPKTIYLCGIVCVLVLLTCLVLLSRRSDVTEEVIQPELLFGVSLALGTVCVAVRLMSAYCQMHRRQMYHIEKKEKATTTRDQHPVSHSGSTPLSEATHTHISDPLAFVICISTIGVLLAISTILCGAEMDRQPGLQEGTIAGTMRTQSLMTLFLLIALFGFIRRRDIFEMGGEQPELEP